MAQNERDQVTFTNKQPLTSGHYPVSGAYPMSGGFASGAAGLGEMVGNGWEEAAAKGFLLAPQAYLLDVADRGEGLTAALDLRLPRPLDVLPMRLTFQETSDALSGAVRQSWSAAAPDSWTWLLMVESLDGGLAGVLSATPPGRRREGYTWRSRGAWNFFGGNRVCFDSGQSPPLGKDLCLSLP